MYKTDYIGYPLHAPLLRGIGRNLYANHLIIKHLPHPTHIAQLTVNQAVTNICNCIRLGINVIAACCILVFYVIPFFLHCHSRAGGNLKKTMQEIPAFAGMTDYREKIILVILKILGKSWFRQIKTKFLN